MSLNALLSEDKKELRMEVDGRFDFNLHHQFRKAYQGLPSTTSFVVDLMNTSFLDSSAIGMLLLLREYAGKDDSDIRVVSCNPEIKKVLEISNLSKLFSIE